MDKRCNNCHKSELMTLNDGTQRLICDNDPKGKGVSGFYWCEEYRTKCMKCVEKRTEVWDDPCFLCSSLDGYPYYQKEAEENG